MKFDFPKRNKYFQQFVLLFKQGLLPKELAMSLSIGIFVGIICAFVAVHIYSWVEKKGWVIKMPAGVPPTVVQSFAALIPATVVMTFFFAINLLFGFLGLVLVYFYVIFYHKASHRTQSSIQ